MNNDSIENLLHTYINKIHFEGLSNKSDQRINAENLYCRLFIEIYGWKDLINLNYSEPNASGIDLYSAKQKIAIQITTIQSNEKQKIKGTIEKVLEFHKNKKIEGIICFFIRDNKALKNIIDKEYSKLFQLPIKIRTTQNLIGNFYKWPSPEKKVRILEILKQEIYPEFKGINNLSLFEPFSHRKNLKYTTPENLIFFSTYEKNKINEIQKLFNDDKIKEYAIIGNPCSGKSTLANAVVKKLNTYFKIFFIDFSNPDLSNNLVLNDINQLAFYHTVIIVENVHDNIELFYKIQQRIKRFNWLKAIYISRYYNSYRQENENSIVNIFKDIKKIRYNPERNFEEKVSGIIENRVKSLKVEYPSFNWLLGDFETVLTNTDKNLLKLNIALETWISSTKKGDNLKFDKINSDNIYGYFYESHKLKKFNKKLLFLYSYLYSYDIPFLKIRKKVDEFNLLKQKGIILNYNTSDYYFFPHKDYASLIYQTLKKEQDLDNKDLIKYLHNYISNFKTEAELNIVEIILKLAYAKELKIVYILLNEQKTVCLLKAKLLKNIRKNYVYELQKIYFLSFDFLKKKKQLEYFNLFNNYYLKHKLELYVLQDYTVYSNLIQVSEILDIELGNIFIIEKNRLATNSIFELTKRISSAKNYPKSINRVLNSYHFPEWLMMIEKLPKLSSITNTLSELNSTSLSKRLLVGIINKINVQELQLKSKNLKPVQITKAIRELQKIDLALNTGIAKDLIDKLSFKNKISNSNLSDYSKSLSELSLINENSIITILEKNFKDGTFYKMLENEKSLNNITASLLELNKIIVSHKNALHILTNNYFNSQTFNELIKSETKINSLLILFELLEKNEIGIDGKTRNKLKIDIKELILKHDFSYNLITNPKILNIPELKNELENKISNNLIVEIISNSKFTILDNLFRVLVGVNKEKTIRVLNNANSDIFVDSMCDKELNMSQSLDVLYRAKNKTFIDNTINSNLFWFQVLDKYLILQKADIFQYDRLNFGDFLKAFDLSLKINSELAIKHFEKDFLKKLKSSNNESLVISSLFQHLRKVKQQTEGKYKNEIQDFLKLNKSNFINLIERSDIQKTTSGLIELSMCNYGNYVDELIYASKDKIIPKLKEIKENEKIKKKVYGDLNIVAIKKSRFLLDYL